MQIFLWVPFCWPSGYECTLLLKLWCFFLPMSWDFRTNWKRMSTIFMVSRIVWPLRNQATEKCCATHAEKSYCAAIFFLKWSLGRKGSPSEYISKDSRCYMVHKWCEERNSSHKPAWPFKESDLSQWDQITKLSMIALTETEASISSPWKTLLFLAYQIFKGWEGTWRDKLK